MPNQRAKNKRQFSVTFTRDELEMVDALAERYGVTRTALLRLATMGFCEKYEDQLAELLMNADTHNESRRGRNRTPGG